MDQILHSTTILPGAAWQRQALPFCTISNLWPLHSTTILPDMEWQWQSLTFLSDSLPSSQPVTETCTRQLLPSPPRPPAPPPSQKSGTEPSGAMCGGSSCPLQVSAKIGCEDRRLQVWMVRLYALPLLHHAWKDYCGAQRLLIGDRWINNDNYAAIAWLLLILFLICIYCCGISGVTTQLLIY